MAGRWRAPGGWTVEVVRLTGMPGNCDGEWLRVRQHGFWTIKVERYVALSELEPDGLRLAA